MDLGGIEGAVLRVAAVVVAAGLLWKGVLVLNSAINLLRTLHSEFGTNGGSSMRDSINRIEHRVNEAHTMAVDAATKADQAADQAGIAANAGIYVGKAIERIQHSVDESVHWQREHDVKHRFMVIDPNKGDTQ